MADGVPVLLTAGDLLLLRQRLSDGPGTPAVDSALDARLSAAQRKRDPDLAVSFWEMEPCSCGRPELGSHEKYRAQWLCRAGYLEKEIGYAISELERPGAYPAGIQRLEKLTGALGGYGR